VRSGRSAIDPRLPLPPGPVVVVGAGVVARARIAEVDDGAVHARAHDPVAPGAATPSNRGDGVLGELKPPHGDGSRASHNVTIVTGGTNRPPYSPSVRWVAEIEVLLLISSQPYLALMLVEQGVLAILMRRWPPLGSWIVIAVPIATYLLFESLVQERQGLNWFIATTILVVPVGIGLAVAARTRSDVLLHAYALTVGFGLITAIGAWLLVPKGTLTRLF
jgi:hypothetical protein